MLRINNQPYNLPTGNQLLRGRHAYERYGEVTDFKNFRGEPMPTWEGLTELIRLAWVASACPEYAAKVE